MTAPYHTDDFAPNSTFPITEAPGAIKAPLILGDEPANFTIFVEGCTKLRVIVFKQYYDRKEGK